MACALDGLTVLDLSTGSAAALATMFLGDHGARVVRLIAPGSSHLRQGGFIVWDRGKACATLDLNLALDGLASSGTHQVQDGRPAAEFLRLVAGTDVLVEDFAPGSPLQRLVDWPRLKRLNPHLTGIAQRVDCDLLGAAIVLSSPWFTRYSGKPERPLADKEQYGLGPFHRLYRLGDGWIYVVAESEAERRAMCTVFGCAEPKPSLLQQIDGFHPNTTPFAIELATTVAPRATTETLAALRAAGVPCSEVPPGDSDVFLAHPHTAANDLVAIREHPRAGKLRVAWQLVQFADTPGSIGLPTPLLGEHTSNVLREIGYSESEIRRLHAGGVVKTEPM